MSDESARGQRPIVKLAIFLVALLVIVAWLSVSEGGSASAARHILRSIARGLM